MSPFEKGATWSICIDDPGFDGGLASCILSGSSLSILTRENWFRIRWASPPKEIILGWMIPFYRLTKDPAIERETSYFLLQRDTP
jgi:hypothetical protein